MNDHDPPPLSAPPILRAALAAARADTPSAAHLASLAAKLPLTAPAAAAAPASVLSGALIGAALGALVSGAALLWPADHAAEPAARRPLPAEVASPAVPAPPRAGTASSPVPRAEAPSPPASPPLAAAPSPARAISASSSTPLPVEPVAAPASPGETAGTAAPALAPETEVHLLERAQDALGASAAEALALTRQHAGRFPGGALAQERELVAIQALLRLGQAGEARARGARFLAAFPGSAHRRRIEALVAP